MIGFKSISNWVLIICVLSGIDFFIDYLVKVNDIDLMMEFLVSEEEVCDVGLVGMIFCFFIVYLVMWLGS